MARKWRNRRKAQSPIVLPGATAPGPGGSGTTASPPPPRAAREGHPASTTPLADYLTRGHPGVDDGYVVLPRSLVEAMPLPWQQRMAALLTQFHDAYADASWPSYRVVPSRRERLVDLDEGQLAEAGYLVEIDAEGTLVYRERSGRRVADPDDTVVLVPCLDPIVEHGAGAPHSGGTPGSPKAVADAPDAPDAPDAADTAGAPDTGNGGTDSGGGAAPAPMNIGPTPVWRTTTPPPRPADAPPLPPPPTASSVSPAPDTIPSVSPYRAAHPATGAGPVPTDGSAADGPGSVDGAPDASGVVGDRDWFDEVPTGGAGTTPAGPSEHPAGDDRPAVTDGSVPGGIAPDGAVAGEFGPTGDEPTEIPYRYRR